MSQRDDAVPVQHIATRHRITHGYDVVDYDILWDTVQDDLPPLVSALEQALADLT